MCNQHTHSQALAHVLTLCILVAEEDGMEEIDLNNIVEGGRRTRGAKIDFAKAAEKLPADEEDDEDEDDDFQPPAEDTEMSG